MAVGGDGGVVEREGGVGQGEGCAGEVLALDEEHGFGQGGEPVGWVDASDDGGLSVEAQREGEG